MHDSAILRSASRFFALLMVLIVCTTVRSEAQFANSRFGFGFNTMLSADHGLGLGFRGRISTPINADLSFAFDAGLTGFILGGSDDAVFIVDPQVSLIITLPGVEKAPYLLAGMGAFLDISKNDDSLTGPTVHFGIGKVHTLRESILFYELDPALIIGKDKVAVAIPFRIGIIF